MREGRRGYRRYRVRNEGLLPFALNLILVDRFQLIDVLQTFPAPEFSGRLCREIESYLLFGLLL